MEVRPGPVATASLPPGRPWLSGGAPEARPVAVAAGVDAITSAFLGLKPHAVFISLGLVAVLAVINLRGVKSSGTIFAVSTYGSIASCF